MTEQDESVSTKWKKEYTVVLVAGVVYAIIFYVLMSIYS